MTKEEQLGLLLRKCREKAGLTQVQLAMRMNWSQSCVSNAEHGKQTPDIFKLMEWARITNGQEAFAMFVTGVDVTHIIRSVLHMANLALLFIHVG